MVEPPWMFCVIRYQDVRTTVQRETNSHIVEVGPVK